MSSLGISHHLPPAGCNPTTAELVAVRDLLQGALTSGWEELRTSADWPKFVAAFEKLGRAGFYDEGFREWLPNPAYDNAARRICEPFRAVAAELGLSLMKDTPGDWNTSTETSGEEGDSRAFLMPVHKAGSPFCTLRLTFFHRHEYFDFPQSPVVEVVETQASHYSVEQASFARYLNLPRSFTLSVGELGARWQFPSDHIPVGAVVHGIRICSWNILNSKWVGFFESNNEGLKTSSIVIDNVPSSASSALTKREESVLSLVSELCERFDVLLLQECSTNIIRELHARLPTSWSLLKGHRDAVENDVVALFDRGKLTLNEAATQLNSSGYTCKLGRPIMNLCFATDQAVSLRIVHTHVPGDPTLPGLPELARYVKALPEHNATTIVAGDLNFLGYQVQRAFAEAGLANPWMIQGRNTCIGAGMTAQDIDNILVFDKQALCREIATAEWPVAIQAVHQMLNP